MTAILDTSFVIGLFERRDDEVIDALVRLGGPSVRSMFVSAELLAGIETASSGIRAIRQRIYDNYLTVSATVESPNDPGRLAQAFASVTGVAAAKRVRVGQNDRWILAEALVYRCSVLTADDAMHSLGQFIMDGDASPLTRFVGRHVAGN